MPPIFRNQAERREAETVLRDGAKKGSFTASGYALIVDRLDQVRRRSSQAGFSTPVMEGCEVTEVDATRRELRCNNTLHDLGLSSRYTGTTRTRQACTAGVVIGVGCCRGARSERNCQRCDDNAY
jgi:hypothetical protein